MAIIKREVNVHRILEVINTLNTKVVNEITHTIYDDDSVLLIGNIEYSVLTLDIDPYYTELNVRRIMDALEDISSEVKIHTVSKIHF